MKQTAQYDHIGSTDEADAERAPMPRVEYVPWYWNGPDTGTGDPQPARSDARIEALVHGLPPMEELWARLPARDAVALLQHRDQVLRCRHPVVAECQPPPRAPLCGRRPHHHLAPCAVTASGGQASRARCAPGAPAGVGQQNRDPTARHRAPAVYRGRRLHAAAKPPGRRSAGPAIAHTEPESLSDQSGELCAGACIGVIDRMVSPFVVPGQSAYRFQGVIFLTDSDDGWARSKDMVAVSLSPCESCSCRSPAFVS